MSVWNSAQNAPLDLSRNETQKDSKGNSNTSKMLLCNYCNKSFNRQSLLERHIRVHTGERPYGCEVCGKKFSTRSSLNTHTRIHTGERPHKCQICGRCFTASSNLYYHRMIHSRVKPHKCTECPRSFSTPGDLRVHTYSHTGNYPFVCSVCKRGFPKSTLWKHHMESHKEGERSYNCATCKKTFSSSRSLNMHQKTHLSEASLPKQDILQNVGTPILNYDNVRPETLNPNEVPLYSIPFLWTSDIPLQYQIINTVMQMIALQSRYKN